MEVPIKERIWNWALGLTDCLLRELTLGPKFQDNKIVVPPAVITSTNSQERDGWLQSCYLPPPFPAPPHYYLYLGAGKWIILLPPVCLLRKKIRVEEDEEEDRNSTKER